VHVEYGTTTAYGSVTTVQALATTTAQTPVSAVLGGLLPGTIYHFRLVASNADGTTDGADHTFTTAPAGSAGPGAGSSGPKPFKGLAIKRQTVRLDRHRRATIKASCPAAAVTRCAGRLTLKTRIKVTVKTKRHGKRHTTHRTKTLKLAVGRFRIASGRSGKLRLRLTSAGATRVKKAGTLSSTATAVATDGLGRHATTKVKIRLRPSAATHRKRITGRRNPK
jgi:hypothetical protein